MSIKEETLHSLEIAMEWNPLHQMSSLREKPSKLWDLVRPGPCSVVFHAWAQLSCPCLGFEFQFLGFLRQGLGV